MRVSVWRPAQPNAPEGGCLVKRLLLFAAVACASISAACGGGGSTPPPPPPGGKFSNASLKRQYAYSISRGDLKCALIARVGGFFSGRDGNITLGLQDLDRVRAVPSV